MNESTYTQDLLAKIRAKHPEWVVLKHCDRFTKGIPDLSVSNGLKTLWLEVKHAKASQDLDDPRDWVDNTVQMELTARLCGFYLVYHSGLRQYLWAPAVEVRQRWREATAIDEMYIADGKGYAEIISHLERIL